MEIQKNGNSIKLKLGKIEIWKNGKMQIQKYANLEKCIFGKMLIWKNGNDEGEQEK